jgi:hypothetical protein
MEPDVADHAVYRRGGSGRQGRVADDGLRVGVQVVGVGVDHAFVPQIFEASAAQVRPVAIHQITAQAVDGDLEDQPRRFGEGRARREEEPDQAPE